MYPIEKVKRAIHFDFHTMPGIENLCSNFNAKEFAKTLKDNGVEYINFTARCNIGFSYYNTKIGVKYEGLERDLLKEAIDACHENNIGVTAYINAGLNHELASKKLEWLKLYDDGTAYRGDKVLNNFFRRMCYNTEWADYLIEEVKELLTYDVDGIFLDCMNTGACYCPKCMAKMKALGIDTSDDVKVSDYQIQVVKEFCKRVKSIVPENLNVYFNGVFFDESLHSHVELECLPSGEWGYDFFTPRANYYRTKTDKLVYMSGRFQSDWGDFGGIKPLASFENDLYDSLISGYALSFGDHLHPVNALSNEVITRIGKVFKQKIKYEKYFANTKPFAEVGILLDVKSDKAFWEQYAIGAYRMLDELKLTYNFYDLEGDFSSVKLLIIPKKLPLIYELKAKIENYVASGGKVIFSGSSVEQMGEFSFTSYCAFKGYDNKDNSYFTLENSSEYWATYQKSALVENIFGKEISKLVYGVFDGIFDGKHGYFYRPQGNISEYSVGVTNGNSGVIAFDLFTSYATTFLAEQKKLFSNLISELLTDREVTFEGLPSYAVIGINKGENKKIVQIKATAPQIKNGKGIVEDHLFIKECAVFVKGKGEVYALPEYEKVCSTFIDGKTVFKAKDILGYKAYLIKE